MLVGVVVWTPAFAGSGTLTLRGGTYSGDLSGSGGLPNAGTPPSLTAAPISPPGTNPFPSVTSDAPAQVEHSSGQNWGQPLGADLYDSDSVHARLNYYYNNDQTSPQQGVGFSLTFPN